MGILLFILEMSIEQVTGFEKASVIFSKWLEFWFLFVRIFVSYFFINNESLTETYVATELKRCDSRYRLSTIGEKDESLNQWDFIQPLNWQKI